MSLRQEEEDDSLQEEGEEEEGILEAEVEVIRHSHGLQL